MYEKYTPKPGDYMRIDGASIDTRLIGQIRKIREVVLETKTRIHLEGANEPWVYEDGKLVPVEVKERNAML